MSRIKSNDTAPELIVRSFLFRKGFRFRVHVKKLPGKPDIVLSKYKTIIEIRGCFWHRHPGCKRASMPKSNNDYWEKKFSSNVARDRTTDELLHTLGWKIIVIWECDLKREDFLESLPQMIRS